METIQLDKSAVVLTENLDKNTVLEMITILNRRINLPDDAYTTMGNIAWVKHFRDELRLFIKKSNERDAHIFENGPWNE